MYKCSSTTGNDMECIYLQGTGHLIENNDMKDCADYVQNYFVESVIRNNVIHDTTSASWDDEHVDGIQTSVTEGNGSQYLLVEGNSFTNCVDGDYHIGIFRIYSDHIVWRYNHAYNINGGLGFGGTGDNVGTSIVYNNTFKVNGNDTGWGAAYQGDGISTGVVKNNIFITNSAVGTNSPTYGMGTSNYNIAYVSGYSGDWDSPYSAEVTYTTLKNLNPLLTDISTTPTIEPSSPAINAGGELTTVAVADTSSGVSLVVSNATFFQPGWAGTQADWIAIGTVGNVVQISSIDYATNTLTLANGISRSDGDSVWLYRKSDGVQVLYGTAPDIGAYEYFTTGAFTGSMN
jgi:hypothetical protein